MSFFSRLFGGAPSEPRLPELTSAAADEFCDLSFAITRDERGGGHRILRAEARHDAGTVGLEVRLGPAWVRRDFGPDVPFSGFQGEVTLHPIGAPSDRLVRVIGQLYEGTTTPSAMETLVLTGISLEGDPQALEAGAVRIKLFLEPSEDDPEYDEHYAELFLNIILSERRLELHEKDPDYRAALMRAWSSR